MISHVFLSFSLSMDGMQVSLQLKLVARNRVVYLGLRCFKRNYSIVVTEERFQQRCLLPLLSNPFVSYVSILIELYVTFPRSVFERYIFKLGRCWKNILLVSIELLYAISLRNFRKFISSSFFFFFFFNQIDTAERISAWLIRGKRYYE